MRADAENFDRVWLASKARLPRTARATTGSASTAGSPRRCELSAQKGGRKGSVRVGECVPFGSSGTRLGGGVMSTDAACDWDDWDCHYDWGSDYSAYDWDTHHWDSVDTGARITAVRLGHAPLGLGSYYWGSDYSAYDGDTHHWESDSIMGLDYARTALRAFNNRRRGCARARRPRGPRSPTRSPRSPVARHATRR